MAKYKLQELPDMNGNGKRKVYPKLVNCRTLSSSEFIDHMHSYNHALPKSVAEAVLTDIRDTMVRLLSMGYNISLDELGTFTLSLGFEDDKPQEMQSDNDKMTHRKVGVKNVNFKASPDLLKDLKRATNRDLERDMGGVTVIRQELYSRPERIARALKMIEQKGFIGLSDYASLNNLSRTAASLELKEICADADCPICPTGSHSHKMWVKRKENVSDE